MVDGGAQVVSLAPRRDRCAMRRKRFSCAAETLAEPGMAVSNVAAGWTARVQFCN